MGNKSGWNTPELSLKSILAITPMTNTMYNLINFTNQNKCDTTVKPAASYGHMQYDVFNVNPVVQNSNL